MNYEQNTMNNEPKNKAKTNPILSAVACLSSVALAKEEAKADLNAALQKRLITRSIQFFPRPKNC